MADRPVVERSAEEVRLTFEGFYRDEYEVTLAVVLALRGPRVGVEEVAQEAFLRAYRSWEDVAAMDHPEYWVRRVAVNLATSRWRRLGAEARAVARSVRPHHPQEDHRVAEVDGADRFWRLVRRLSPQQQRMVALRYAADLGNDQIAETLGVAPGTVKVTLHRARQRLEELLQLDGEDLR